MNILAIDTSSKYFSLAIAADDKIKARFHKLLDRKLSNSIIPVVDETLKKSKLNLKEIDCFALGVGPGSFTALRIGCATIKGFAFGLGKAIVGVNSLDVQASAINDTDGYICPIVDAKRQLVYSAVYRKENGRLRRKTKYFLSPVKDVLKHIKPDTTFTGDGIILYEDMIRRHTKGNCSFAPEGFWYPLPEELLALALQRIKAKKFQDAERIKPFYLYSKECQVKK